MKNLREKITDKMSEISMKREFRNHILKLISKYRKTDKLIPDSELLAILLSASFINETVYIKALINKCRKNISPLSLDLYEEYIELVKKGETVFNLDELGEKYIDDNSVVDCVSSNLYIDENALYAFDYIIENGDTFTSLCKKFQLPVDKQGIQGEKLIVGDVVTLFTEDDTLAEYQQAIFEYINSGRNNKNSK